ncbi:MAG TPA: NAD(P)-dependent alcohol dehydrogenase [Gemmatimonadales bacterium]|nr:NAD(P)-dependent alcohol dehydrogenase [Gemmatimonadales bacterium]
MQAAIVTRYGPPEVVQLRDVTIPIPGPTDIIVRMQATTVTAGDWRIRSCTMPRGYGVLAPLALGFGAPRQPILGSSVAGDVMAVGEAVRDLAIGDSVVAATGMRMGCHAEYVAVPATAAVRTPETMTFEQAATLPFGGMTALDFLRRAQLNPGDRILVTGAAGVVGSAIVQLAVQRGIFVTATCRSANVALVKALGAHAIIDHAREPIATMGVRYTAIADTTGVLPYAKARALLLPNGRLLAILGELGDLLRAPLVAMTSGQRIIAGPAAERASDLRDLVALTAAGRYTPLIDSRFSLGNIVEAHRRVEAVEKRGSVVVTRG